MLHALIKRFYSGGMPKMTFSVSIIKEPMWQVLNTQFGGWFDSYESRHGPMFKCKIA